MPQHSPRIVVDKDGLRGVVVEDSPPSGHPETQLLVRFDNGQQVNIPEELLKRQKDGNYHLALSVRELLPIGTIGNDSKVVIPVMEERLTVQASASEPDKVEIRKTVRERVEVVDQPLVTEEVEIERIAINRPIKEPISVRHEGDTLVIPLLEEVLVVEKQLILREEVRIKKLRKETYAPQEVTLREEQVEVVRKPGSANAAE
jgi:uncharacterized protein (TIGR02271 family)